jgi:4'-phosphopantetheinyl transferase
LLIRVNNQLFVPQLWGRELTSDEIHIWCASLEQPVSRFQRLLSTDEIIRSERFHFEEDRRRFIVRHGILRTLLGCYLGVEPSRLQFCCGKNEKPKLTDEFSRGNLRFNLSHSGGLALYAFTCGREIGVDIERVRDIPEMEQIAERFFSIREHAVFRALPESEKKEAFFNCWTRKEAFIKATGDGLSWPLDRFDVSLVPGEPARLLKIEGDSRAASRWSIQDLKPASGFAAALAVKDAAFQIKNFKVLSNQATAMTLEKESSLIEAS